jgi:hypothetical protein
MKKPANTSLKVNFRIREPLHKMNRTPPIGRGETKQENGRSVL